MSQPPPQTALRCSELASRISSSHRCSRKKCLAKGSRNPLYTFSTKNPDDHEFILQLYQKLIGSDLPSDRMSRSMINAIERNFATNFECCKDFVTLMNRAKKRKNFEESQPRHQTTRTTKRRLDVAGESVIVMEGSINIE